MEGGDKKKGGSGSSGDHPSDPAVSVAPRPPPIRSMSPFFGMPAAGLPSIPAIRIQDSIDPGPPSSRPPAAMSLKPPRPSRRRRIALVAVLLAAIGALAIVRPSFRDLGFAGAAAQGTAPLGSFAQTFDVASFQRGNLHAHSTLSDGHDPPRDVVAWYRDHGYQFLALSEHDKIADVAALSDLERPGFVLIPSEEISSTAGSEKLPVHVNGVCMESVVASGTFDDTQAALAQAVAGVRAQHGFPIVNHPNWGWALSTSDLATLGGSYALEIRSGHPDVHQLGDPAHPSPEQMWDELLARGRDVIAVGVDDVHQLAPEKSVLGGALPGRAWVHAFGGETTRVAICEAIAAGRLYVSTGLALQRIAVGRTTITVWVDDERATVDFVSNGGQVLEHAVVARSQASGDRLAATYTLRGGEPYVRARVVVDGVGAAWTQAYRVAR